MHLIVETPAARSTPRVWAWLAQRPRFRVHYTPTYAYWLSQVERWFGNITQRAIRRGSFSSVLAPGFRAAVGTDHQDRALRGHLQQDQGPIQLDGYGRFNPGEAPATLLAKLLDGTLAVGAMESYPAGGPPQPLGLGPTLTLQFGAETLGADGGRRAGRRLGETLALQPLHPLLDQHLGHVAHRARILLGQGGQPLAEILRKHHLDPW